MTKKQLRKEYSEKRRHLTTREIMQLDDLLLIQFQQWPVPDIQTLLSYWPIEEKVEINTRLMTDYLSFRIPGLRVAYPVIGVSGSAFTAILVDENTEYRLNAYGIAEPSAGEEIPREYIDLVFVPLIAFDKNGYRVGYGKGFYDRFLSGSNEEIIKLGFSYFDPVATIDDVNEFDVPLNICITPNMIYEF